MERCGWKVVKMEGEDYGVVGKSWDTFQQQLSEGKKKRGELEVCMKVMCLKRCGCGGKAEKVCI